jgi:transcription antitermination factor NusG
MCADKEWFVLYTRPQMERKVVHELYHRSIDCYLPLTYENRQWSDRVKNVEVVVFPNYIFVHTHPKQIYNALDIRGAVRYLQSDGKPATLKQSAIESIKKLVEFSPQAVAGRSYKTGDKVKIVDGPLTELTGYITNCKGNRRFYVELPILSQTLSIEISALSFEKV